jgi:hypothetical protein
MYMSWHLHDEVVQEAKADERDGRCDEHKPATHTHGLLLAHNLKCMFFEGQVSGI